MKAVKFRFDWTPPPSLGANSHRHWRGKHPDEQKAKDTGREVAEATRYTANDIPNMPVLVFVIHWEKASRRKDDDNALGTLKHLRDGMCQGLGIDDRRFTTSMVFQKVDPKKIGYTEAFIREATLQERRLAS